MKSIRRHLTMGLLGMFLVLWGTSSLIIYFSTRAVVLAQLDARLRVEALAVVKQTKQERGDEEHSSKHPARMPTEVPAIPGGRELDVGFSGKHMPEFESGGSEFYQVWAPDTGTVKRSKSLGKTDLPQHSGTLEQPAFWNFDLPGGGGARGIGMSFVPSTPATERQWHDAHFHATLTVATSLDGFNNTLAAIRGVLAAVAAIGLAATLLSVPLIVRGGLQPLQRVADQVSRLRIENLNVRFPADDVPLELRAICLRLNELLGRLDHGFERERCFAADVAHELRTPIAELRSLAEVSLQWPDGGDNQKETFQDALGIAVQMEAIVTTLLAISRCESGRQVVKCQPIDLASFVQETWRPHGAGAQRKNLHVVFAIPRGIRIQTDADLLGLILTNLFSNAVEYSPRDATVEVRFDEADSSGTLSVTNAAPDLNNADVPKLFERFWRKDAVRTSSGHLGLGLALSKACAGMLGIGLFAELREPQTIRIAIAGL